MCDLSSPRVTGSDLHQRTCGSTRMRAHVCPVSFLLLMPTLARALAPSDAVSGKFGTCSRLRCTLDNVLFGSQPWPLTRLIQVRPPRQTRANGSRERSGALATPTAGLGKAGLGSLPRSPRPPALGRKPMLKWSVRLGSRYFGSPSTSALRLSASASNCFLVTLTIIGSANLKNPLLSPRTAYVSAVLPSAGSSL